MTGKQSFHPIVSFFSERRPQGLSDSSMKLKVGFLISRNSPRFTPRGSITNLTEKQLVLFSRGWSMPTMGLDYPGTGKKPSHGFLTTLSYRVPYFGADLNGIEF